MGLGHERLDGYTIHEGASEYAVSRKDTDADPEGKYESGKSPTSRLSPCEGCQEGRCFSYGFFLSSPVAAWSVTE